MRTKAVERSREPDSTVELRGRLILFGFPSTPVSVEAIPRSPWWRGIRAFGFFGSGVALAAVGSLVPPHAPWVLGALGVGGYLGIRRWKERLSILSLRGHCPKCGKGIELGEGTPLRPTVSLSCDGCLHNLELRVMASDTEPPEAPEPEPPGPPPHRRGRHHSRGVE